MNVGSKLAVLALICVLAAPPLAQWVWQKSAGQRVHVQPSVDDCRLDERACQAVLPGGRAIAVSIEPRPIPALRPLSLAIVVTGAPPSKVELELSGDVMNMGVHRPPVVDQGNGRYASTATLPVCVTGRMAWRATVFVDGGGDVWAVPFRFVTGAP